jgi:hypothetical protein
MEILKDHTRGFCSICYQKVDARVVERDGQAVIQKTCPDHGMTEGIVERDADLYRRIVAASRPAEPNPYPVRNLMMNITHGCNLNCHLCYVPNRDTSLDMPIEDVKECIRNYPGHFIVLSGGEPTLRPDVLEIIDYCCKMGKMSVLITNGLKLADKQFVQDLRSAGIGLINLSFNGLKEEAYTEIENAKLLEIKKRALDNIGEVGGIWMQLGFTMVKGINDDQYGPVLRLGLERNHYIYHLRARVATGIGRSLGAKNIFLSDFIEILSKAIDVPVPILLDHWFQIEGFPNPHLFTTHYYDMLIEPLFSMRLMKPCDASFEEYLARFIGARNAKNLMATPKAMRPGFAGNFIMVLFSWPDVHSWDEEEAKGLNLDILTRDKRVLPYWEGIITNEKFNIL